MIRLLIFLALFTPLTLAAQGEDRDKIIYEQLNTQVERIFAGDLGGLRALTHFLDDRNLYTRGDQSGSTTSPKLAELIRSVPHIKDTSLLINRLIKEFDIEADSMANNSAFTIDRFEKTRLYGTTEEYVLIEFNTHGGPMALFPYKHQFIFNTRGQFVSRHKAESLSLIRPNQGEQPYLLLQHSTARGNGWHELYRGHGDSLINVFGDFNDYFPKTYDAHDDFGWNEPYELRLTFRDDNNDGRMDLIFSGTIVAYNHPRTSVEFIFLATRKGSLEWFIQKEDYSKKYAYLTKKKQ